jgi:hypothetical protein
VSHLHLDETDRWERIPDWVLIEIACSFSMTSNPRWRLSKERTRAVRAREEEGQKLKTRGGREITGRKESR